LASVSHVSGLTPWPPVAEGPLERVALPGRSAYGPSWPLFSPPAPATLASGIDPLASGCQGQGRRCPSGLHEQNDLCSAQSFPCFASPFRLTFPCRALLASGETPWPLFRVISPNMTSGLSMGLAVTPCHKIHTMDLHRRLQWPSCTTFSVTVLYPDPLGVRVVYNSSPDISVI
jgi:hypothetical protein